MEDVSQLDKVGCSAVYTNTLTTSSNSVKQMCRMWHSGTCIALQIQKLRVPCLRSGRDPEVEGSLPSISSRWFIIYIQIYSPTPLNRTSIIRISPLSRYPNEFPNQRFLLFIHLCYPDISHIRTWPFCPDNRGCACSIICLHLSCRCTSLTRPTRSTTSSVRAPVTGRSWCRATTTSSLCLPQEVTSINGPTLGSRLFTSLLTVRLLLVILVSVENV